MKPEEAESEGAISPAQLRDWRENNIPHRLVDVRERDEWEICRIEGAELLPLSEFAERYVSVLGAGDTLVLLCHHGMRSANAQAFLKAKGFKKTINLSGGIDRWSVEVDPSVARY